MIKRVLLILALLIPLTTQAALQPGPLMVVLVGTKDATVSVLNEAMNIEFSRGVTSPISESVGFKSNFPGFLTGQTEIRAWLIPLVDNESTEPTAFSISFWWQTQRNDGKQHITSLISQIKTIATKHGDVVVADNISSYRSLGEQQMHCFAKLDNDPLLTVIKDKVALVTTDNTTFSMLANDSTPTDEEKKAIMEFASKRDACNKTMTAAQQFFPNDAFMPMLKTTIDASTQVIIALYKGQLTYGNCAKIRKENGARLQEGRLKITNELKAKDADANERAQRMAMEQQRVFIEQQKAYADLYRPIVAPANRIKSTNCSVNGNQIDCTTF